MDCHNGLDAQLLACVCVCVHACVSVCVTCALISLLQCEPATGLNTHLLPFCSLSMAPVTEVQLMGNDLQAAQPQKLSWNPRLLLRGRRQIR